MDSQGTSTNREYIDAVLGSARTATIRSSQEVLLDENAQHALDSATRSELVDLTDDFTTGRASMEALQDTRASTPLSYHSSAAMGGATAASSKAEDPSRTPKRPFVFSDSYTDARSGALFLGGSTSATEPKRGRQQEAFDEEIYEVYEEEEEEEELAEPMPRAVREGAPLLHAEGGAQAVSEDQVTEPERSLGEELFEDGVCVFHVLSDTDRKHYADFLRRKEWPEFNPNYKGKLVMGGFGAYGHYSSFHHKKIRELRAKLKDKAVRNVFSTYSDHEYKWSRLLFDRVCERNKAYGTIPKESWHQDLSPPSDNHIMFGGWLNLCDRDQYLIGIRASQHERFQNDGAKMKDEGFVACPESRRHEFDARLLAQSGFGASGSAAKKRGAGPPPGAIRIPPGHAIVFQQGLVHSVNPTQPKESQFRLFVGFELSKQQTGPHAEIERHMNNFSVPKLPSEQQPPMYAVMHWINHAPSLSQFAVEALKPEFRQRRTMRTTGVEYVVPDMSTSLRDKGVWRDATYDYAESDRDVLRSEQFR